MRIINRIGIVIVVVMCIMGFIGFSDMLGSRELLLYKEYNIDYSLDGGINDSTNPYEYFYKDSIDLKAPSKEGYTFIGWTEISDNNSEPNINMSFENKTGDKVFIAHWKANQYSISFNSNFANNMDSIIVSSGEEYELPIPTSQYEFAGWYYNNKLIENTGVWNNIFKDISLEARWYMDCYIYNYFENLDGSYSLKNKETEKVILNEEYEIFPKHVEGYITPQNQRIDKMTENLKNINVYYKRETYQISLINSYNKTKTFDFKYEEDIIIPEENRESFTFGGYYSDYNLTQPIPKKMPAYNFNAYVWWQEELKPSELNYKIEKNGVIINGIKTSKKSICIPKNIGDKYVIEIASKAFSNKTISEIIMPSTIKTIGDSAFYNCSSLKRINSEEDRVFNIPNSVTSIGLGAFKGCSSLRSITLPFVGGNSSATSASTSTLFGYIFGTDSYTGGVATKQYYSNSSYTTYYIPSSLKEVTITGGKILYGAFYNCSNIEVINIPNNITSIGKGAFSGCSSLRSITIPNSVTSIGYEAFSGCSSLQSITLPFVGESSTATSSNLSTLFGYIFGSSSYTGGVKTQQYYTYSSSSSSTTYYIPSTLKVVTITVATHIPFGAFYNCSNIETINIPDSVTSIGDYAFYNCNALKYLNYSTTTKLNKLPKDLKTINNYVFYGCNNLLDIKIGDKITEIDGYSFYNCNKLTNIQIPNSVSWIGPYAFYGCKMVEKVNSNKQGFMQIPSNVTYIGKGAFYGMLLLTDIEIPESVTSIGYEAFSGCSSLRSITLPFVGASISATSASSSALFGYIFGTDSYTGGVKTQQYYSSSSSTTYYIPSTLKVVTITVATHIPFGAFYNCSNIETINIPDSVTSIGDYAFYNCNATQNNTYKSTAWDGHTIASSYNSGNGTSTNPYIISTGAEFAYFANQINAGYAYNGVYFKLANDIYMSGVNFNVIGTGSNRCFKGKLDGSNYEIKGISITSNNEYVGLFGYLEGTIKNVTIRGTIKATNPSSVITEQNVGLVGYVGNLAKLDNVTSYCTISAKDIVNAQNIVVGGITGKNDGEIKNCITKSSISIASLKNVYVGGLVGTNEATLKDSSSYSDVSGKSTNLNSYVGGAVAGTSKTINACSAYGDVSSIGTSKDYSYCGGFISIQVEETLLIDCYRSANQYLYLYDGIGYTNTLGEVE